MVLICPTMVLGVWHDMRVSTWLQKLNFWGELTLSCIFHSYYDILEDRVPAGLVAEYHSVLALCSEKFQEFSSLRSDLTSDSESEQDNVSMVEGLRMYEQLEAFKRKLRIIENPLLRLLLLLCVFEIERCHVQ